MVYIFIILFIFLMEYLIKAHVEEKEDETKSRRCRVPFLLVTKYHNRGACLEVGKKKSSIVRLISVLLTVVLTIFFFVTLTTKGNGLLKLGLSFLLGGAYSNTYDRMKRKYVVDYFRLNVPFAPVRRVIFNIADLCILVGALIVTLRLSQ